MAHFQSFVVNWKEFSLLVPRFTRLLQGKPVNFETLNFLFIRLRDL